MIKLQVNGKQVELERATPLLAYIEKLGVDPQAVAVEHNGTILERAAYKDITLNEGDAVEIVRMVGGGALFSRWSRHSRLRDALHTRGSRHTVNIRALISEWPAVL